MSNTLSMTWPVDATWTQLFLKVYKNHSKFSNGQSIVTLLKRCKVLLTHIFQCPTPDPGNPQIMCWPKDYSFPAPLKTPNRDRPVR